MYENAAGCEIQENTEQLDVRAAGCKSSWVLYTCEYIVNTNQLGVLCIKVNVEQLDVR